MKIKNTIFYVLSVVICFLLQTSVFEFLKLNDVMPNILLILTVSFAIIKGQSVGMGIGFACGLLIDIFSGDVMGQYALLYVIIGFVNGCFHEYFYEDEVLLPIALLVANSFIYSLLIFTFFFVLRGRINLLAYLRVVMIPEAVYTGVLALPIFYVISMINYRMKLSEKRS
ncbi:MAG: rod shape-determining protein MreD [Anaerostipes sp.]|jgi:rod shape-determining protein MreD|nr:rod shape-determining protein MreD [Anaerostipes sp.]MDD3744975.1 rod shape-determining protein MreD [Anaerostipes sp.]